MGGASNIAKAIPGDLGYRFNYNNITARDLTVNYGVVMAAAGADFSAAGNFSFFTGPSNLNPPFNGHVAFAEANYGPTTWWAISNAYNAANQPCSSETTGVITGNCSMSQGAEYGYIRFNTQHFPSPSMAVRHHLVRHEFAHILGLGHDFDCFPADSIMETSSQCAPMFTTLQTGEINLINAWYP